MANFQLIPLFGGEDIPEDAAEELQAWDISTHCQNSSICIRPEDHPITHAWLVFNGAAFTNKLQWIAIAGT